MTIVVTPPTPPTAVDRHVVIVSVDGSFTAAGERLTGPVTSVDKLEKLIDWACGRALLQPIPIARAGGSGGGDDATAPARLWVVGAACRQLVTVTDQQDAAQRAGDLSEQLGRALAPLVGHGWELRGTADRRCVLARGRAPRRIWVEVVAEPRPWLSGGTERVADDAVELGRRLRAWSTAVGVLPATSGALSAPNMGISHRRGFRSNYPMGGRDGVRTPAAYAVWHPNCLRRFNGRSRSSPT